MADENISDVQRQLSEAMLAVQQDLARFGKVSQQSAENLTDAQMKAKFGVENFTKASNTAGAALGALAGAGVASAQAMYKGQKGMGAFNSSLDELSKAAALAGTALTLLIPGGFIIKGVVAGLTMAATAAIAYTKAANDMADKLYKSYTGLQKSGAAASDGMTGVFRDAKKLGLSMDELDSMVSLIADSSQDLALFSGTVYDGRKKFADMGKALEGSRAEFFKLGLTQTEVNEGMAGYLKTVTRTGRAQTMTTDQLAASARGYIYEQDALAKITGMSVKQQQAALEKALQNEQFLSKIRQLEADGDFKKADELKKLNAYYAQMGDEAAEGFQATVNGNLRNKAAQKLNFASQGEVLRSTQQVLEENKSAAQAFDSVAGRVAETEKTIGRTQAAFGTTADSNLKYTEQVNFAIAAQGEKREELEKKVNAEIEKQKKGADKITGNQGDMIKTQQEINAKLEEAVFKGIPNAQANMSKLANVTDTLANAFTTLTDGLNRLLKLVGLGEKEAPAAKQMTAAEIAAAGATAEARNTAKPMQDRVDKLAKELDADEKALKDAKRAGKYGAELKPLEDKILKNKEEYEKATKELIDAENQIKKSAQEEGKIRLKQMQDRKLLQRLENANLSDTEEIAKQNEKRADAIKAGKSTADIDKKISGLKTNIEGRSAQVTQLQADLKTSAVGGGAKPEEVLQFSGESGQRSNFDGLSEGMKTKLLAAGQQYFEQTGQKLQMNSGARDPEDQKRLYDETVQAGRPGIGPTGMPVAPPGKSSHETGNAVDIQNYSDPKAVAAMNAQGLRQTVPKDPVHFAIQAADGGVFSGPDSGYPAALHGEEAVIPLNNGGGNFVKIFEDMAMMMGKQVGAIDELIRIAKNSNDIQTKILRVQQ
jgi:LAS superfamily LD-carboxypeptidase LdcB